MQLLNRQAYQVIGIVALALWVTSIFSHNYSMSGWHILEYGWMLPLVSVPAALTHPLALISCFAWYANLILPFLLARLFKGLLPSHKPALIALLLSLSALAPVYTISEADMRSGPGVFIRGEAIWLWLSSFMLIYGITFLGKSQTPDIQA